MQNFVIRITKVKQLHDFVELGSLVVCSLLMRESNKTIIS